jgi:hypothetical protein
MVKGVRYKVGLMIMSIVHRFVIKENSVGAFVMVNDPAISASSRGALQSRRNDNVPRSSSHYERKYCRIFRHGKQPRHQCELKGSAAM